MRDNICQPREGWPAGVDKKNGKKILRNIFPQLKNAIINIVDLQRPDVVLQRVLQTYIRPWQYKDMEGA